MTEEESNPMSPILENMPLVAILEGAILIIMGVYFYLFPEDEQSVTALIPAFIGLGLLIPGYLAYNPAMKMHAMHATAVFALIGTLGGAMGIPEAIAGDWGRTTIARIVLLLLCGEYMFFSIMSFRAARIKREQEENEEFTPSKKIETPSSENEQQINITNINISDSVINKSDIGKKE